MLVSPTDPELVQVSPESFRAKAYESIRTSLAKTFTHLTIMTSHYGPIPRSWPQPSSATPPTVHEVGAERTGLE